MTKDRGRRRDLMRERLVHQAARLMAVDGITDHAFAKRKAARQLGAPDTKHMPSNHEIDEAVMGYRALYQQESHPEILQKLRKEAMGIMRLLQPFQPYLTGSVLQGTAGKQSTINIVLFCDDTKAVMLFLLRQDHEFEEGESRVRLGGREETIPRYILTGESGTQICLIVLPEKARRSGSYHSESYADIPALEAMLNSSTLL